MIKNLSVLVFSSGFVAFAACSDDGGGSPSSVLVDSIETSCAKFHECKSTFPGDAAQFEMFFGANEAACVMNFGLTASEKAAFDASVSAGRIKFNAADANKCVAANSRVTCEQLWNDTAPEEPACETAVQGQVAAGGMCTFGTDAEGDKSDIGDCSGDLFCDEASSTCMAEPMALTKTIESLGPITAIAARSY